MERRLAAILAADAAGYSRLVERDEAGTLAALKAHLSGTIAPSIAHCRGRLVKTTGDGLLAEFASAVNAVQCALEVQRTIAVANAGVPEAQRIEFRIGISLGDVVVEDGDLFGDGVNLAARLEQLAEPGGICIAAAVYDQLKGKLPLECEDIGLQTLKNIAAPVHVYRLRPIRAGGDKPTPPAEQDGPPLPSKPSIAVLPFSNMSGDPEQAYFADGIVEDIITALSRIRWLFVIARNSSFAYKGRSVDVKQVARELGVRYVLEGSVRKSGSRVRITGQLIDAATGSHIWAERYDRELVDIFALQDEITECVAGVLEPSLRRAEIERARRKRPDSLDAYDLYLRALPHFYAMTREGSEEAERLLRQALALDPDFGAAAALASLCLVYRVAQGWAAESDALRETMLGFAAQALRVDKDDPEALGCMAHALAFSSGRFEDAIAMAERAVAANPNSAFGWHNAGFVYMHAARPREAVDSLARALRLSPLDPMAGAMLMGTALAYIQLSRDEDALAAATRATRESPSFVSAWRSLAASLALLGRIDEARAAVARVLALEPQFSVAIWDRRMRFHEAAKARYLDGLRKAGLPD